MIESQVLGVSCRRRVKEQYPLGYPAGEWGVTNIPNAYNWRLPCMSVLHIARFRASACIEASFHSVFRFCVAARAPSASFPHGSSCSRSFFAPSHTRGNLLRMPQVVSHIFVAAYKWQAPNVLNAFLSEGPL